MANALEDKCDIDGNKIYKRERVYDWLEHVRVMGEEQNFLRKQGSE